MNDRVRFLVVMLMLGGLATALAACGDTWRGFKEDTGQNMQKAGETIEKAGSAVKP
jgi:predicted small secreted protein